MKKLFNRKNYRKISYVLIGIMFVCFIAFVSLNGIADNADNAAYSRAVRDRHLAVEAEGSPMPNLPLTESDADSYTFDLTELLDFPDVPPQRPELRTAAKACIALCFVAIAALLALGIAFGRCPHCESFQGRGIRGTHCKWCGGELD